MEELQVAGGTKADEVYAKLRLQIVSGDFMPGDKVTIRQIAGLYQVSMMPVRQALSRLHSDGFVSITNRTVKIKELSAKDVKDIFAIRIRLETLALEWAIPHIDEEKAGHLQQIIDQMGKEYNPDIEWGKLNKQFHLTFYSYADSPSLLSTLRDIWGSVEAYMNIYASSSSNLETFPLSYEEHQQLISFAYRKETNKALDLLVKHLSNTRDVILQELNK